VGSVFMFIVLIITALCNSKITSIAQSAPLSRIQFLSSSSQSGSLFGPRYKHQGSRTGQE